MSLIACGLGVAVEGRHRSASGLTKFLSEHGRVACCGVPLGKLRQYRGGCQRIGVAYASEDGEKWDKAWRPVRKLCRTHRCGAMRRSAFTLAGVALMYCLITEGKMPEHLEHTAENLLNNIMESLADSVPKQKSVRFFEEDNSVSSKMNKLFGRQKSVHHILGGGKSADVLLWRNKKISSSVLTAATAVWILFEWLNYHFLTLVCFALVIGMLFQFVWSNASGVMNRSPSDVPRLVLPDEFFVNVAVSIGAQINQFLCFIQDVACGRNLKQFLAVVASLLAAAVIGSWCNFLTVLYIGYVSAHTLPVLYEKYEDEVDDFIYRVFGQFQSQYRKLDGSLLSKIPKGNLKMKKSD
ncbi:hypothetical protein J5N97_028382 [Dioscorea zingiberensis]|uniref:Reticulon-like protein n=1 Tax=Dioscorea zingiberensis TaxID=325984 RepID=A0A9D5BYV9_9LILI|nr:hypothetical protein J5N97_028382 [Dioscorea zingiberensis]